MKAPQNTFVTFRDIMFMICNTLTHNTFLNRKLLKIPKFSYTADFSKGQSQSANKVNERTEHGEGIAETAAIKDGGSFSFKYYL